MSDRLLPPRTPLIPSFSDVVMFLRANKNKEGFSWWNIPTQLAQPTSSLSIQYMKPSDGELISKVRDAEEMLFKDAYLVTEKLENFRADGGQLFSSVEFAIRRQAAYIAQRGRRSLATGALMHPKLASSLTLHHSADFVSNRIGRWQSVGLLIKGKNNNGGYSGIDVYINSDLEEHECYVFLNSQHDFAAALVENGSRLYLANPGSISDYITKITFYREYKAELTVEAPD